MAVAGRGDRDARREVEVLRAVGGGHHAPVARHDLEVGDLEPHPCNVLVSHSALRGLRSPSNLQIGSHYRRRAMLDVRRIRTEPDAVRAGAGPPGRRRGRPRPGGRDLDERHRKSWPPSATTSGRRVNELSKEVGALRGARATRPRPRRCRPRAGRSARRSRRSADERPRLAARRCATCCCASPTCRRPTPPTAPASRQPGRDGVGWATTRRLRPSTSGCRTGRPAPRSASSTTSGPSKISGAMFTMQPRAGRHAVAGAVPAGARPQRRRVRGDPPAHARARRATLTATGQLPKFADDAYHIERDDLWCIPTAEVPLTSHLRRRDPRRGRPADAADGLHAVLPARGRLGRARHPRHAARPRVRQGRDPRLRHARAGTRAARRDRRPGRGDSIAALGLPYRVIEICTGDMGQSHHRSFDIEVYAPGCDQWLEVLVGHRGSATTRPAGPTSATGRRARRAPRCATRSTARPWRASHGCGHRRDPPPARRLGRGGRLLPALPPRRRAHHRPALTHTASLKPRCGRG